MWDPCHAAKVDSSHGRSLGDQCTPGARPPRNVPPPSRRAPGFLPASSGGSSAPSGLGSYLGQGRLPPGGPSGTRGQGRVWAQKASSSLWGHLCPTMPPRGGRHVGRQSLCVCVSGCVYECVSLYVYVCLCGCVCLYVCMYLCVSTSVCVCVCVCAL